MGNTRLLILSEPKRGTTVNLDEQEQFTVGRTESNDIYIPESSISGLHCTFYRQEDGTFAIRDEGSTNGTRVNDEPLSPTEPRELKNGDIIQIGAVEVLFDQKGDSSETSTSSHSTHQSVINILDTKTNSINASSMKNLGMRTGVHRSTLLRDNKKHAAVMMSIVVLLAVAAIGVIGYAVFSMLGNNSGM